MTETDAARERLNHLLADRADVEADIADASETFANSVADEATDGHALDSRSRLVDLTTAARIIDRAAETLSAEVESRFGRYATVVDVSGVVPLLRIALDSRAPVGRLAEELNRWSEVAYSDDHQADGVCFVVVLTESTADESISLAIRPGDEWAVFSGSDDVVAEGDARSMLTLIAERWPVE